MKNRTLEELAQLEKAIGKKYGEEALINPNSNWDQFKEKDYLQQLKSLIVKEEQDNIIKKSGFSLENRLINKDVNICPICEIFISSKDDEMYLTKYECCELCYIKHIEGRENLWEEKKNKLLENKGK